MITSRAGNLAMRRGLVPRGNILSRCAMQPILCSALSTSTSHRSTPSTTKIPASRANEILEKQRLNRPIAPHLEVYKLSQTYLGLSAWMRITGCTIFSVTHIYFSAYLLAPIFGVDIGSEALAAAFGGLPGMVKGAIKMALAWPFSFHFVNGIKHLINDAGWGYKKANMVRNEWLVFGVSVVTALAIAFAL